MKKIVRVTTVASSLWKLLEGQLSFMKQHYDIVAVANGKEILEKVGRREGVAIEEIEFTRSITPLNDLRSLLSLYRLLKREKPFIIHTHTPKAGTVGMLAAKLARVPHRLHTVAGLPLVEAKGARRALLNNVERLTYSCATKVYPNSRGLQEIILENKFTTAKKLKVLADGSSNGINTTHFSPEAISEGERENLRRKLGIEATDTVLIFVGRIVGDKGINELVRAFNELAPEYPNLKLLIVGTFESELDPVSDATKKSIETHERILAVGWKDEVRPYFAISSLLVFPSYREGFPNVVMQAGAMGLPSIVSDINGCNEIIQEGHNGTIVPVKDYLAIKTSLERFLKDKGQLEMMAANARESIVSRYDQRKVWEAILAEYRTLE